MELNDKKDHVIRCIKLGMTLSSAMYCAECTDDEMTLLEDDDAFNHKVKIVQSLEEYALLEDHALAARIAAAKGNTAPIQWKLAHINKERWGNRIGEEGPGEGSTVNINIPNNGR